MMSRERQLLGVIGLIIFGVVAIVIWGSSNSPDSPAARADNTSLSGSSDIVDTTAETEDLGEILAALSSSDETEGLKSEGVITGKDVIESEKKVLESKKLDDTLETVDAAKVGLKEPEKARETAKEYDLPKLRVSYHKVAKGETLTQISRKYYGRANSWRQILKANSMLLTAPEQLRPGMKLRIPKLASSKVADKPAAKTPGDKRRTHVVKKGETLSHISERYYKKSNRWQQILSANSESLHRPEDLKVGMKIVIP